MNPSINLWNFLNSVLGGLLQYAKFASFVEAQTPISTNIYLRQIERHRSDPQRDLLWSVSVECHNRELWSVRLHICHTSCKTSHLSSITLFSQDAEWRIAQNCSFAISCNKSLSFGFSPSLSSSSLSVWLSLAPSAFLSLFLLLSRSFCRTHFMFPPSLFVCFFLFLFQSHSLFVPSITYFPLLSFPFSFTLSLVY